MMDEVLDNSDRDSGPDPGWEGNPLPPEQPCTAPRGQYHRDCRVRGSEKPLPGRCGRRLRNSEPPRFCTQYPLKGRDACKYCGGKTPAGVASPHYKDGTFSRYMPRNLRKKYREAIEDPD